MTEVAASAAKFLTAEVDHVFSATHHSRRSLCDPKFLLHPFHVLPAEMRDAGGHPRRCRFFSGLFTLTVNPMKQLGFLVPFDIHSGPELPFIHEGIK